MTRQATDAARQIATVGYVDGDDDHEDGDGVDDLRAVCLVRAMLMTVCDGVVVDEDGRWRWREDVDAEWMGRVRKWEAKENIGAGALSQSIFRARAFQHFVTDEGRCLARPSCEPCLNFDL